ncbi:MAG: PEP-CTERM sorting domain-containing protein [Patescibacteria group bacterium]|nr:PEP-CTERM sorting domain-containing protein [Patescibacteria group bacterium]
MTLSRVGLTIALLSLMTRGGAYGESIYIDFGDHRGSASQLVDGSAATWNVVPTIKPFAVLSLNDASGASTGIQISAMTGFDTVYDDTLDGGAWNVAGIPWSTGAATADSFACSGSGSVVFSNLAAPYYRIELIASRADAAANRVATYLMNDEYADFGGPTGSQSFSASIHGWGNKSWMIWDLVEPDENQQITLSLVPDSENWSYVNAMTLQAVPEPTALLLLLVGLAVATASRRRPLVRRGHCG